jgi:hypothetical protein
VIKNIYGLEIIEFPLKSARGWFPGLDAYFSDITLLGFSVYTWTWKGLTHILQCFCDVSSP